MYQWNKHLLEIASRSPGLCLDLFKREEDWCSCAVSIGNCWAGYWTKRLIHRQSPIFSLVTKHVLYYLSNSITVSVRKSNNQSQSAWAQAVWGTMSCCWSFLWIYSRKNVKDQINKLKPNTQSPKGALYLFAIDVKIRIKILYHERLYFYILTNQLSDILSLAQLKVFSFSSV